MSFSYGLGSSDFQFEAFPVQGEKETLALRLIVHDFRSPRDPTSNVCKACQYHCRAMESEFIHPLCIKKYQIFV